MPVTRSTQGSHNSQAKLTEADVVDILNRAHRGEKRAAIGRRYHVSASTITLIVLRRTWRHVPYERPTEETPNLES